jgi:hypothetical protein
MSIDDGSDLPPRLSMSVLCFELRFRARRRTSVSAGESQGNARPIRGPPPVTTRYAHQSSSSGEA